ncbi:RHS repeat-associated core domain-containing protein [Pseudomonas lundensis]|uniref:RHS repeat-associated core domain-containing protein n=1 Tax=Pseudomonas lundensis TaxID=86185 RepID=UPI001475B0C1|nr:RHS repeat-associated core domain-containing protein [Pseudomonas lundensis]NNA04818.1 RHS repeat-associated core domain-containing protein [Pseudomonas lundensis]
MKKSPPTLQGSYQYDALDRLTTRNTTRRFYQDERIATEIEGERKTRFFETDSQPLALQQHGSGVSTTLLATDQQSSVLSGVSPDGTQRAQVYTPFGYHVHDALLSAIGFNGERPELETGHYLLGQGYRAFNPVLMRFNSPDSWSPFGEGGINAYAYCDNEPMMRQDPTGHFFDFIRRGFKGARNLIGARKPGVAKAAKTSATKSTPRKSKKLNPEQEKILADAVKKQVHKIIKHNIEFSKNANHGDITILQYHSKTFEGRNAIQINNIVTNSTLTLIPLKISTSGSSYASTPNISTRPKIQPQGKFNIADEAGNIRTWHISN